MPDNCCTEPIVTTPNPDLTCCCTNCGDSNCGCSQGVGAGDPGNCGCGATEMTGSQDDTVSGGCKPTRSGLKSCAEICQPTSCGGDGGNGGGSGGGGDGFKWFSSSDSGGGTAGFSLPFGGGIGSTPNPNGGGGSCGTSCGCSGGNGPGNDPVKYANSMASSVQLQANPNVPNPGPGTINLGTGNVNFSITPPNTGSFSPVLNLNYNSSAVAGSIQFGYGWADLYNPTVSAIDSDTALVVTGNGSGFQYDNQDGNGVYAAPTGTNNALKKTEPGRKPSLAACSSSTIPQVCLPGSFPPLARSGLLCGTEICFRVLSIPNRVARLTVMMLMTN